MTRSSTSTAAAELAAGDEQKWERLLYRAEIVHERDGDRGALEAYRDLERAAAGETGSRNR